MKKYLPANYTYHAIEGSLFFSGMCFISFETVLPQIIKSLGGSTWMIALAPSLLVIGCSLPTMFTAGMLARSQQTMPSLKFFGMFQRLPFLLAGIVLLSASVLPAQLVLWTVLAAPFFSGLSCGATLPAWFDLVARTVPGNRITHLFALRFAIGALAGIAIGALVKLILTHWPDAFGYGLLFLGAALFLYASYFFFIQIKEPGSHTANPDRKRRLNDSGTYGEIIADRVLMRFILLRFFACGSFIAVPFISIQALKQLHLAESWLGYFVIAVIAGAISGNLFASRWSRRHSCRSGIEIAAVAYLLMLALAWCNWHPITVLLAFFTLGFARDCWNSFSSTLVAALPPKRLRMKSIALITTCYAPGLILSGLIGAVLWNRFNSYSLNLAAATLTMLAALAINRKMPRI